MSFLFFVPLALSFAHVLSRCHFFFLPFFLLHHNATLFLVGSPFALLHLGVLMIVFRFICVLVLLGLSLAFSSPQPFGLFRVHLYPFGPGFSALLVSSLFLPLRNLFPFFLEQIRNSFFPLMLLQEFHPEFEVVAAEWLLRYCKICCSFGH